jgi:stress response protein SCP2
MGIAYYPSESLELNIARGLVKGTTSIHKFGAVPTMSTNTTGTIWDVNDTVYPWSSLATASVLTLAANATENSKAVTIYGLDSNYNSINETVTISGGAATTTQSFLRVFRAFCSATNTNNIDIKVNSTTVARITAGLAQTLMSVYTVPANYTGYLLQGTMSAQSSADATGNMFVRYFGQTSFRVGHSFEVSGAGGQYLYRFAVPIAIPEKSDIDIRITTRSNNGRYTSAFDMILIKTGLAVEPL